MFSLGGNERQVTFHCCLFALERGVGIFTLSLGQQFAHLALSGTENICSDCCVFIWFVLLFLSGLLLRKIRYNYWHYLFCYRLYQTAWDSRKLVFLCCFGSPSQELIGKISEINLNSNKRNNPRLTKHQTLQTCSILQHCTYSQNSNSVFFQNILIIEEFRPHNLLCWINWVAGRNLLAAFHSQSLPSELMEIQNQGCYAYNHIQESTEDSEVVFKMFIYFCALCQTYHRELFMQWLNLNAGRLFTNSVVNGDIKYLSERLKTSILYVQHSYTPSWHFVKTFFNLWLSLWPARRVEIIRMNFQHQASCLHCSGVVGAC